MAPCRARAAESMSGEQLPAALILAMILALLAGCAASGGTRDATGAAGAVGNGAPGAPRDTEEEGDNCTWACLRWAEHCNVDPRGVYRCQRVCEQFGEICE